MTYGSRPTRWPTRVTVTAARQRTTVPDVSGARSVDSPVRRFVGAARAGPAARTRARAGAHWRLFERLVTPRPNDRVAPATSASPRPLAAQIVELHRRGSIRLGPPHEAATIVIGLPPLPHIPTRPYRNGSAP